MSIEIANESGVGTDEPSIVAVARFALEAMGVSQLAELSIMLVELDVMEDLHQRWMALPGPTDVMAFPMEEVDVVRGRASSEVGPELLGDIVLCPRFADDQARKAGHELIDELHLLTVHGVLHLLGYDHAEADEEREMFALQRKILTDFQQTVAESQRQAVQRSADSRVLGTVGLETDSESKSEPEPGT